jgi:Zn finger protein HypA/HybF involved in hydrogenase expression
MAKNKKPPFKLICKDCNLTPEPNKEQSNENWNVYDMKCPNCGKQLELDFQ